MSITLTEIFTKIGDWVDDSDLYVWLVKNQPDILLEGFCQLYQHPGTATPDQVEEVLKTFVQQGDQLDLTGFFVNMCASATAVSFLDSDNGRISQPQQERFIAEHAKVSPLRISFHIASMSIINILRHTPLESAGNLPKHLAQLFEQSKIFVLPEKRQRQCPRVVKIKAQKYPRKCQSIS